MALFFVLMSLAVSTFLALNRPKTALLTAVFFVPWAGLDVDVGLRVTAYLVFITPVFLIVLVRLAGAPGSSISFTQLRILGFVVIYAIAWTLSQAPFLPEASIAGGWLRQPVTRSLIQIIMFLITLSPLLVVPMLIRSAPDLIRLGKIYLVSVTILAAIGWLQLAVWVATGSDPFPVGFFDNLLGGSASNRSGAFVSDGIVIYRMSSFGGEPKGLGASLAVALLLLQTAVPIKASFKQLIWYFLFVSMIATFSTMAILGWLAATSVQFFITSDLRFKFKKIRLRRSGLVAVLIGALVASMIALSSMGDQLGRIIETRTVDRVTTGDRAYLEEFNVAITDFLLDQPLFLVTGVGLGNAHLYANDYLPIETQWYAAGTPFVAKSLALKFASELGLVVLLVFSYWVISSLRKAASCRRRVNGLEDVTGSIAKFGLPLFAFALVSVYVTPHLFMALGCALAIVAIARDQSSAIRLGRIAQVRPRHNQEADIRGRTNLSACA